MNYLSHEHRILRYLAKVKASNTITGSHVKCLKSQGEDYAALSEINFKRQILGLHVGDVRPNKDAEFDINKFKFFFTIEREYMTQVEFDTAINWLRANGYLHPDKLEATQLGVMRYQQMEEEEVLRGKQEINRKRAVGDKSVPSFSPLAD